MARNPDAAWAFILLTTSWEEIVGCLSLPQSRLPLLELIIVTALYLTLSLRLARGSRIDSDIKPLPVRVLLVLTLMATIYAATYPNDLIDGIAASPTTGTAMFFASTVPRANQALHGAEFVKIPLFRAP